MPEFPIQVARTDEGEYTAKLVDCPGGPMGRGVDPYAAQEDLLEPAQEYLHSLEKNNSLPQPSPAEDRPVISLSEPNLDESVMENEMLLNVPATKYGVNMICYSWTSQYILYDS